MNTLKPPLAIVEKEDEEFLFFSSPDQMLTNAEDALWGDAYDGWDAAGQYFSLVRREGRRRWWHRILSLDSTFLAVECVQPAIRLEEAERRLRRHLGITGSNLAQLIAAGLTQNKQTANSEGSTSP